MRYSGPPPSLSSSATVRVGAHDHAAQRALRRELEQDLRVATICAHDARELVGRAAAEDEVVPLGLGRQVAELALQEVALHPRGVDEPVVGVDAAAVFSCHAGRRAFTVSVWPSK